jgi:ParB family chromosome partitioning protein
MIKVSLAEPRKDQPRKNFDREQLQALANSIAEHGVIQPIIVTEGENGYYTIIAGERRWRASRLAGLEKVPVVIKELDDAETMEIALIENLQREDLNPVEEAMGYKTLMETFSLTQEQVATKVGKSRPAVANSLRLLSLESDELEALQNGEITQGHARTLLSLPKGEIREEALRLAKSGASVRELENISKMQKPGITVRRPRIKNKVYVETEAALAQQIGRKVKISGNGKTGTLQIEFFSEEDLFDLASKLAGGRDE